MHRMLAVAAVSLAVANPLDLHAQQPITADAIAVAAAEVWLELVDDGEYQESWNQASPVLQQAVTADQWAAAAGQARTTMGAISERSFVQGITVTELPDAPPGEYALIEFRSSFVQGPATERVVLRLEGEDKWRVVGSFVAPVGATPGG